MREILFRAKHYRTKQWVYGIPFKNPLRGSEYAYYPQIIPEVHGVHSTVNSCSIIEETMGQFTSLTDKNGVKIFENGYMVIDNKTYKVIFDNAEYILTNIFNCDIITLKNNSIKGVFVDEI